MKMEDFISNLKQEFEKNGRIGPIKIFDEKEIDKYKNILLEVDAKLDLMNSDYRCKSNVLFKWVDEISRNPQLVKIVSKLIGDNFHCWDTLFWLKKPYDEKVVSYHQDATYWNFENKNKALTVWLAFNDVYPESGSIEYASDDFKIEQFTHEDVKNRNNLLMRGQTSKINPKSVIKTTVPAGNILIHSPYILHGSGPNLSREPRLACGFIYVSTECKPRFTIAPESSIMINGTDQYNYVMKDPRPSGNWDIDLMAWRKAYDRQHANYYQVTQETNAT